MEDLCIDMEDLCIDMEEILCIDYKEPALPNCYSKQGIKEVFISGFCEKCFDRL